MLFAMTRAKSICKRTLADQATTICCGVCVDTWSQRFTDAGTYLSQVAERRVVHNRGDHSTLTANTASRSSSRVGLVQFELELAFLLHKVSYFGLFLLILLDIFNGDENNSNLSMIRSLFWSTALVVG